MTQPTLRFITAGSVDDGKSTLIGRLLFDSKALLADQIDSLKADTNGQINFAALTDGLSAEQEQGITIDVAYRYFATAKRKFIIADTPGHEQYTRNMITGASTADAAIILIDATRVDFSQSPATLLPQTKRHSAILKLLTTPQIIIAINKLDLLNFSQSRYQEIVEAYQSLVQELQLNTQIHYLPISALHGDNIVVPSARTPWYQGEALLPLLENLPSAPQHANLPAHFPVQRVIRQDGSSSDDFRGYQGLLETGTIKVGDRIRISPSGQAAQISQIITTDGEAESAQAGEVLTITLDADLDISRGDSIISEASPTQASQHFQAALCWFSQAPLNPSRRYLIKHTTQTTTTKISQIESVWNINTLAHEPAPENLQLNDIGKIRFKTQQPLTATTYATHPSTGAFILIDEASNQTVAAGMIETIG